ncbi:hypothetical protein [Methylotenera mobilis]|uniref:Secreted protein n=1 Tax=Methylotenera mobilis (strain JLW8 / ATCC BAA-1282 / DSM 17540) TaxID=583345 RepID=C6WW40_METML|nr:hypothetical protein [Methylotenera mobilis]ACT48139.1 hypothetical protein Mmol_1233 [Methylotenera mobilis JLW8]
MRFKLIALTVLILVNSAYSAAVMAASNPPLDIIELLGEMEDDSMLAAALTELDKKPAKTANINSSEISSKQHTDTATPAGGNKK